MRDDRSLLAPVADLAAEPRHLADPAGAMAARPHRLDLAVLSVGGRDPAQPQRPLPDNRFIGEPGYDRYDTDRATFGWLFEHRFNDEWAFG